MSLRVPASYFREHRLAVAVGAVSFAPHFRVALQLPGCLKAGVPKNGKE
jgi:hypothetical protein